MFQTTNSQSPITLVCHDGYGYANRCKRLWQRPVLIEEVPELKECCDATKWQDEHIQYHCKRLEGMMTMAANTKSRANDPSFKKDYANLLIENEKRKEEIVDFRWSVKYHMKQIFKDFIPTDYTRMISACSAFEYRCDTLYHRDSPAYSIISIDPQHLPIQAETRLWCSVRNGGVTKCRPYWVLPKTLGSDVLDEECHKSDDPRKKESCEILIRKATKAANAMTHGNEKYYSKSYRKYIDGKDGGHFERRVLSHVSTILSGKPMGEINLAALDFMKYCKELYNDDIKSEFPITVGEDLSAPS
jgi:hypothetical protein